jgi:zinc D-Ala-D-Ala carboxypeptidase
MQLSKYFSLQEVISSQTATRKGIDNTPNPEQLATLRDTCAKADQIREFLGHPVVVTSGFRSPKLNAAIGGSKTSSHMTGEALDIRCPGYGSAKEVFDALRKSGIQFDQLILEFPNSPGAWVHVGFGERMRNQHLTYDGKKYEVVK